MCLIKQIDYGSEKVVRTSCKGFSVMTFPEILSLNDFTFSLDVTKDIDNCNSVYLVLCASLTTLRQLYNDFKGERTIGIAGCYIRNQLYVLRDTILVQIGILYRRGYFRHGVYDRINYYLNTLNNAIAMRVVEAKLQARIAAEKES